MKKYYLLFLALLFTKAFSQSYSFPENFNPVYDLKPGLAFEELSATSEAKQDPEKFHDYVVNYIYHTQFKFDNDQVYMDWPEAEVYMLRLLDTIIPKGKRKNLDIFLSRSTTNNASATRHGLIFLNIGLLAAAENEAELVEVMAHEAAHYLYKHAIESATLGDQLFEYNGKRDATAYQAFYKNSQREEVQADSFAFATLKRLGYSLTSVAHRHEMFDMKERVYRYSVSYKNMLKASSMSAETFSKHKFRNNSKYDTHPSAVSRMEQAQKASVSCTNCKRDFIVDSSMFVKYKRIAHEECKKILFENSFYRECLAKSFIDYLYKPKSIKNLYLICECLRRITYKEPDQLSKGFLGEVFFYSDDKDLSSYNKSILYKPDYLFEDYKQYTELIDHPFFKNEVKPFNSYSEAFLFFSKEALALNINEANFGLGLFYYRNLKTDSCQKYLNEYLKTGGNNQELAEELLKKARPSMPEGKLLILYNNIGNYTGYQMNYFLTLQRKKKNLYTRNVLQKDTSKIQLVFVNELMGKNLARLYTYQKLENAIFSLYDETDIEVFKKPRLSSRETMDELSLSRRQNKSLVVYAPEWYKWMRDERVSKIFDVELVYQYKNYIKEDEYYNNYMGYYLDINSPRPYFKDGIRNGFIRKQKEEEMAQDFNSFLFGTE